MVIYACKLALNPSLSALVCMVRLPLNDASCCMQALGPYAASGAACRRQQPCGSSCMRCQKGRWRR